MERRCYWVGGAGVRVNYTNLTLTVTEVNTAFHCKEEEEGDLSTWPRGSLCCSQNHVVVPNKASQHSTKTNVGSEHSRLDSPVERTRAVHKKRHSHNSLCQQDGCRALEHSGGTGHRSSYFVLVLFILYQRLLVDHRVT